MEFRVRHELSHSFSQCRTEDTRRICSRSSSTLISLLKRADASAATNPDVCETIGWGGASPRMCASFFLQPWLIFGPSHRQLGGSPLFFYHFRLRTSMRGGTVGVRGVAFSASMAQTWTCCARLPDSCLAHFRSQCSVHSQQKFHDHSRWRTSPAPLVVAPVLSNSQNFGAPDNAPNLVR